MATFEHPIVDQVAGLGFACPDRVMITHSSALAVRGVDLGRPLGDIDIVTDPENILSIEQRLGVLATQQYEQYEEDQPFNIRFLRTEDGELDIFAHDFIPELFEQHGRGRIYPDRLFALHDARYDQDERTKLWVASLAYVEIEKRKSPRPKDADTLRRLAQYHALGY